MDLWLFILLLLVAEIAGTIGGFGSSMLVMPLAGWFLPFEEALGLTALFHVFSNAAKMLLFRKGFSWQLLKSMGIPAVIGVIIGARLTHFMQSDLLLLALAITLIVLPAFFLLRPLFKVDPSRKNAIIGGGASGFIAGLVGTGGAIRGITMAAFDLEKQVFISTSAWIDMGVDLSRTVIYAGQGYITSGILQFLPVLAIVSVAGSWIGKKLLVHIPQLYFRRVVLLLVLGTGIYTLIRALSESSSSSSAINGSL
jgi:uncharacterized membrane protein YfcA